MTRLVLVLVALAACKHGGGDDYPIVTGGDDVISNPGIDAAAGDAAGDGVATDGTGIVGRVCVMTDLRVPTSCVDTDVGGITVSLGDQMALTADNGAFSIPTPTGVGLIWRAGDTEVVSSVEPFTTSTIVPMITEAFEQDLFLTNGVLQNPGEGSAVIYVVRAGAPLAMVTGSARAGRVFGDASGKFLWNETTPTGAAGVLWFSNMPVGEQMFTLQADQGTPQTVSLPVEDGAITYGVMQL